MTRPLRHIVDGVLPALVIAAVVSGPLLPPEHVHRGGIEGRTAAVVHAHAPDGDAAAPAGCGPVLAEPHGDHALALFLRSDCTIGSRAAAGAAELAAVVVDAPLAIEPAGAIRRGPAERIHGPPGPVWIPRGPPSVS